MIISKLSLRTIYNRFGIFGSYFGTNMSVTNKMYELIDYPDYENIQSVLQNKQSNLSPIDIDKFKSYNDYRMNKIKCRIDMLKSYKPIYYSPILLLTNIPFISLASHYNLQFLTFMSTYYLYSTGFLFFINLYRQDIEVKLLKHLQINSELEKYTKIKTHKF